MPKSEKSRSMWRRASLVEDFEDERSARGRLGAHHDRLPQAGERVLAPGGLADVHGHDRLAGGDRVADLLVEHEADRGVDRGCRPSRGRRRAACPAWPIARAASRATRPSRSERTSIVSAACGSSERSSHTRGLPPCSSITRRKRSSPAPTASASRTRARAASSEGASARELHHPGRELDRERLEVLGAAALQRLDALGHLERVAGRCARAAGPCR